MSSFLASFLAEQPKLGTIRFGTATDSPLTDWILSTFESRWQSSSASSTSAQLCDKSQARLMNAVPRYRASNDQDPRHPFVLASIQKMKSQGWRPSPVGQRRARCHRKNAPSMNRTRYHAEQRYVRVMQGVYSILDHSLDYRAIARRTRLRK